MSKQTDIITVPVQEGAAFREIIRSSYQDDPQGNSLIMLWDEVCKVTDTNQLILANLQQTQVHIQNIQSSIMKRRKENAEAVKLLKDQGVGSVQMYLDAKAKAVKEDREDMYSIVEMNKLLVSLAQEYRQCTMQRKYNIHLSLVMQFRLAIEAAIHRHVPDQMQRNKIADDIQKACRDLFAQDKGMMETQ